MEEKTILFSVLAVVTVVAVIGMISFMKTADTGMGIYVQPGMFYRGLAIRQLGSGQQSAVSNIGRGIYVTAGEAQSPSSESKHIAGRIPTTFSQCIPRDESGNFMYDAKENLIVGFEAEAYSAQKSKILRCTPNYFSEMSPQPDHVCCYNTYSSMVPGSTGAAYNSY
ncbi:MAG: hypothetical protein QW666_02690 [Candidatus Woesearchaeota archaeon]